MKRTPQKTLVDQETYKLFSRLELQDEIERVKTEIEVAYDNFQNVIDPDLIDCCIYQSNAAWKRYRFLLRQAKNLAKISPV